MLFSLAVRSIACSVVQRRAWQREQHQRFDLHWLSAVENMYDNSIAPFSGFDLLLMAVLVSPLFSCVTDHLRSILVQHSASVTIRVCRCSLPLVSVDNVKSIRRFGHVSSENRVACEIIRILTRF